MASTPKIIVEACVGNCADSLVAVENGADRVEFCRLLEVGGLTPDFESFQSVRSIADVPIVALIRQRDGDFHYSESDWRGMIRDADKFLDLGADGVVFGALNAEKEVDISRAVEMLDLVRRRPGKEAVFHRAFDESRDMWKSWTILRDLGVDRILTGGGAKSAKFGVENLRRLEMESRAAGSRPEILMGGRVRGDNVVDLLQKTEGRQVHTACASDEHPIRLDIDEFRRLISAIREFESRDRQNTGEGNQKTSG